MFVSNEHEIFFMVKKFGVPHDSHLNAANHMQ